MQSVLIKQIIIRKNTFCPEILVGTTLCAIPRKTDFYQEKKMQKNSKDKGVIFVLLERFNKQRLPRALEMEKRVDCGEPLNELDHLFIKEVLTESRKIEQLVERNPEFREIYEKAFNLWKEIIDKDLENQKKLGK